MSPLGVAHWKSKQASKIKCPPPWPQAKKIHLLRKWFFFGLRPGGWANYFSKHIWIYVLKLEYYSSSSYIINRDVKTKNPEQFDKVDKYIDKILVKNKYHPIFSNWSPAFISSLFPFLSPALKDPFWSGLGDGGVLRATAAAATVPICERLTMWTMLGRYSSPPPT